MKSSFLKIFAGHFQHFLKFLECQDLPPKRRKQLSSRANHYLAYMTLSSADFSKTFISQEGRQKAFRSYRRFLRDGMNYATESLDAAMEELGVFHDFVDSSKSIKSMKAMTSAKAIKSDVPQTAVSIKSKAAAISVASKRRQRDRLSARPGARQK